MRSIGGFRDPWRYERLNTVEQVLLAKRVPGEPAATARHLSDLLRLRPTGVERIRGLFETAVKGGDLARLGRDLENPRESLEHHVLHQTVLTALCARAIAAVPGISERVPPHVRCTVERLLSKQVRKQAVHRAYAALSNIERDLLVPYDV